MLLNILQNRNFLYLWSAQILTQTSLNMLYYLLTIKVWESTQSNSAVSLLVLSFTLPAIFFGPIAGVLIDRWDTKKALIATNLIRSLLILLFIFILKSPFSLLPLIFVISLVTQFFVPAEGSAIPGVVPKNHLLSANSLFTMTINVSMVVGFILSGPVVRLVGSSGAVIVVFICFLLATFLSTQIPHIMGKSGGKGVVTIFHELYTALKFIWQNKNLRKAALAITSVNAFIMTLSALGPGYVSQVLKMDVLDAGLILVAPGVLGIIIGGVILSTFGRDWSEDFLVDLGFIVSGIILVLFSSFAPHRLGFMAPVLAILSMFTLGVFGSFVSAPATTILHKMTPEDLRGRIYGVVNTMVNGVSFTPILIAGGLADLAGVGNVIAGFGVVLLFLGFLRARHYLERWGKVVGGRGYRL
ncbi:MAG: hypothetical protein A3F33_01015 [Candidatus Woykebacteria bacterium RIFCSPHIGHO2_12_FULL_43_10]|uniref:Major facilitator superfamily (MFS) profile domain-containing protein n=2 Tax=Candidatus Woykeibacteriota TaxID=1817899 RepID=A0A1G1WW82_9BACT|nr:MAG: hypothetical protein A2802_00660 [Candidatus Woykebacteria bacterium RIFCSPHIGHO2_01_FULL_43_29]OGY29186.1 MAG: hypothetical protein A3F33_01015 [Candidatus Woykebacteria bacterium RIFCSPHIGHO2_12_FULL_43_10]OGY29999.1 MAG: hypothetical protein A3J50_02865 [Candidatus Woykebacteria bacterium RIFCSPHIGHO2_02_FULL_43_16b]OGY32012.1 MAG: hypothetical protein A3A61_01170 [Candidatus Woykebacteria bacterium RIFCSPLOWO2_01_FULL_43_14]